MQTLQPRSARLAWPDVLRAIAMYGVGLCHMGHYSTVLSVFAMCFVVQLFFFISGLFAASYARLCFGQLVKKLALRLLAPYYVLALLNIAFAAVLGDPNWKTYPLQFVLAIRNRTFVPGMWFVPALVVTIVAYWLLTKLVPGKWLRLGICLAISLFFRFFKEEPQWFWSADCAMMFLFYYAAGEVVMPWLQAFRFGDLSPKNKAVTVTAVVAAGGVLAYTWYLCNLPQGTPFSANGQRLYIFVSSAVAIGFFVAVAMALQRCRLLQIVGQNTLILCCVEWMSSVLVVRIVALFGVGWQTLGVPATLVYAAVQLLFGCFCIALPLRLLLPGVFGRLPQKAPPKSKT